MATPSSRSEPRSPAMIPERSEHGYRWFACLCSPGVNRAAVLTSTRFLTAVELLEYRRKVTHNALKPHLRSMHEVVAVRAVPLKRVVCTLWTRHLDNQSDGVGLALRRVANMLGKKKDLAFLDRDILRRFAGLFDDTQHNVALKLIEKFLGRIVMIIAALVRATHNSDHELAVFPHLCVAHGRLQLVPVFIDPDLQIEGF